MSDLVTLLSVRTKVRQRADMVNSLFCTDAEINGYIVDAWKELYDLLVEAVEDYALSSASSTITSGNTFALPSDFYKMRGLDDLTDSANPRTVRKFQLGERNDYSSIDRLVGQGQFSDVLYRIEGANVSIVPADRARRSYSLLYVPTPVIPTIDASTMDVVNGFDKYMIADAAIQCKIKEESDISGLVREKGQQLERITKMRANRDQNLPEKVTRVRTKRSNSPFQGFEDI